MPTSLVVGVVGGAVDVLGAAEAGGLVAAAHGALAAARPVAVGAVLAHPLLLAPVLLARLLGGLHLRGHLKFTKLPNICLVT